MTVSSDRYYMCHRGGQENKAPYFWWTVRSASGDYLDMKVPDKGLALAITKFLNREPDAGEVLDELWLKYHGD